MLGPAVSDLQSLVELPTGCGEQNMAKLVPNIVVMEYLKVSLIGDIHILARTVFQRFDVNKIAAFFRIRAIDLYSKSY